MIDIEALKLQTPFNAAFNAIDGTPVEITAEERKRITITDPQEAITFAVEFLNANSCWWFLADWTAGNHDAHLDDYWQWAELKKTKAAESPET